MEISKVALPIWYATLTIVALISWILSRMLLRIIHTVVEFCMFRVLKHFVYPPISQRFPALGRRYELLTLLGYIAVNIVCVAGGTSSCAEISARAAIMSLVNMIPLLCGPRLVLMTDTLGLTLRAQYLSHNCLGLTAMAQALLHSVLSGTGSKPLPWSSTNITGVGASSALGLLFLLCFQIVRQLVYEWFLRVHLLLTVAAILAIFLHLPSKRTAARVLLGAGVLLWTSITVIHGIIFLFRNFVQGRSMAVAQVIKLPHALHISIKVPRPWNVRAGQWVLLSIPGIGIMSGVQFHPFMIAWWDRGGDGLTLSLLVKPRRGFTRRLAGTSDCSLMALIDGPYGINYSFGRYGTVLMFATGVGIAGQLPHIKEIITGYNDCTNCTRRVVLIWQIDKEVYEQWIKDWIDAAREMDTGHILEIELYISHESPAQHHDVAGILGKRRLGQSVNPESPGKIPYGARRGLVKLFAQPNIDAILETQFAAQKGTMVVSVCADSIFASTVRDSVRKRMDKAVSLVELDFEPPSRGLNKVTESHELEFQCRGEV